MAPTARELARESVRTSILGAARTRLAKEGPAQLSLRAVARDVGMVSSAVYRYFPSRDELLTTLLVEAYGALSAAVEKADGAHPRNRVGARWVAACRAIRDWCLAHPGEFALLYGSPVPGYAAPQETLEPATRTTLVLVGIVLDAVGEPGWRSGAAAAPAAAPAGVASVIGEAMAFVRARGIVDAMPAEVMLRTISAWTIPATGTSCCATSSRVHLGATPPAAHLPPCLAPRHRWLCIWTSAQGRWVVR